MPTSVFSNTKRIISMPTSKPSVPSPFHSNWQPILSFYRQIASNLSTNFQHSDHVPTSVYSLTILLLRIWLRLILECTVSRGIWSSILMSLWGHWGKIWYLWAGLRHWYCSWSWISITISSTIVYRTIRNLISIWDESLHWQNMMMGCLGWGYVWCVIVYNFKFK